MRPEPGKTVCKGRWVQIYRGGRSCYASGRIADHGRRTTGNLSSATSRRRPRRMVRLGSIFRRRSAITLALKSGEKVHWRFVEAGTGSIRAVEKIWSGSSCGRDPDLARPATVSRISAKTPRRAIPEKADQPDAELSDHRLRRFCRRPSVCGSWAVAGGAVGMTFSTDSIGIQPRVLVAKET